MDGVLSIHEIMHHAHVKKQGCFIFKTVFEKANDKVNGYFLLSCCRALGFSDNWCSWSRQILHNWTVSVKLNNIIGR
jgi:hypothetical protein